MTREQRIEDYLTLHFSLELDLSLEVADLLRIADDRTLLTLKDFSQRIGRNATTIKSWQERGNVQVPEPAYRTSAGPLWDLEVIKEFCRTYPKMMGEDAIGAGLDFI